MKNKFVLSGINGSTPMVKSGSLSFAGYLRDLDLLSSLPLEQSSGVIVSDINPEGLALAKSARRLGKKAVLVRGEPAVVCPLNFNKQALKNFSTIIDVGRIEAGGDFTVSWPQNWQSPEVLSGLWSAPKVPSAVLINANKLSFIPGELYSLRRSVIDKGVALCHGLSWDSGTANRAKTALGELYIAIRAGTFPSAKALSGWFREHPNLGPVNDKLSTLSGFRVAVVIENSVDYMSEKLMDALFAGCIPVYVGPPVGLFGIPDDLVIEVPPNLESVKQGVAEALGSDWRAWERKQQEYINDPATSATWQAKSVFARIVNILIEA